MLLNKKHKFVFKVVSPSTHQYRIKIGVVKLGTILGLKTKKIMMYRYTVRSLHP